MATIKKLKYKRAEKVTGLAKVTFDNYNRPIYIYENGLVNDENWIGMISHYENGWEITFFGKKENRKNVTFNKREETMDEAKKLSNYLYSRIVTGCNEIIRNKLNWEILS